MKAQPNFFEFMDSLPRVTARREGDGAAVACEEPAAVRRPRSDYLESSGNSVIGSPAQPGPFYKVRSCGCKSRFCERCCKPLGHDLRKRLTARLKLFDGVYMLSLTVDPSLFRSAEEAYEYLRDKRCVARLVDKLFSEGHLATKDYFYVVEWQKRTEFAGLIVEGGMAHAARVVGVSWRQIDNALASMRAVFDKAGFDPVARPVPHHRTR